MAEVKHTLFACVTCDPRGETKDSSALGNKILEALQDAVTRDAHLCDKVEVQKVTCMGGCEQPCTVAFAAPEKVTWVFTQQSPETVPAILHAAKLYVERPQGQMLREERMPALQGCVLCRVPAVKS